MTTRNVNFSDIISNSAAWTKTMLFMPLSAKKWIWLFVIASLAGGAYSSINVPNFNGLRQNQRQQQAARQEAAKPEPARMVTQAPAQQTEAAAAKVTPQSISQAAKDAYAKTAQKVGKTRLDIIIALIILFAIALMVLGNWLYSAFSFVFIESIAANDASVRRPLGRNRAISNSYFWFNMLMTVTVLFLLFGMVVLVVHALQAIGVFDNAAAVPADKVILTVLPYALAAIASFLALGLLYFIIAYYALVVMYKDRMPIWSAIPKGLSLVRADIGAFVLYMLIKIVLSIFFSIISLLITLCLFIGIAGPGLFFGFGIAALYKMLPAASHVPLTAVLIAAGIPVLVLAILAINMIFLPFTIFLKTFSLKFIARLDERYDVFKIEALPGENALKCAAHHANAAIARCTGCGELICKDCAALIKGDNYCAKCTGETPKGIIAQARSPKVAAFLSFVISGLGQVYNGQTGKGFAFMFTGWLIVPWIYGIFDAYFTANAKNEAVK